MEKTTLRAYRALCEKPLRLAWVVAAHAGERSVCPVGAVMNCAAEPFMMAVSVSPENRTYDLVVESGEFVLAWPGEDLAAQTLLCGTRSARKIDKFAAAGLTPLPAEHVGAPLVAECLANLECRLAGTLRAGDHTIFTGEVLAAWVSGKPSRVLCLGDDSSGYERVSGKSYAGYRFVAVKR